MEFKKTIQKRLFFNICYLVLGLILVASALFTRSGDPFYASFGAAMAAVGVVQMLKNLRLLRSDKACRHAEVAEKDERNVMLAQKARSWAFSFYILGVGIGVMVCLVLAKYEMAQLLAWSVLILTALYWVCYMILQKRN